MKAIKYLILGAVLALAGCKEGCDTVCKPQPRSIEERVASLEATVQQLSEIAYAARNETLMYSDNQSQRGFFSNGWYGTENPDGSVSYHVYTAPHVPLNTIVQQLLDHDGLEVHDVPGTEASTVLAPKQPKKDAPKVEAGKK